MSYPEPGQKITVVKPLHQPFELLGTAAAFIHPSNPFTRGELMRVYVTKYALTEGILTMEAELCQVETMIKVQGKYPQYFHGKEWHTDLKAAKARAEEMCQNKIKSVKKQLKKLETMEIKVK